MTHPDPARRLFRSDRNLHFVKLAAVVHAQDIPSSVSACKSVVPRAWGTYKGSSPLGLNFEDEKGILRFINRPSCGVLSQADGTAASTSPRHGDR